MFNVTDELLQRAISLLGEGERRDAEILVSVARLVPDKLTAHRLIDWIPEAFGYVLLPHVGDLRLPAAFTARAKDGGWREFSFDREPIFAQTVAIATAMYADNPRGVFSLVAKRSTMVQAVNAVLNEGRSAKGIAVAGPAIAGVPAEFYDARPKAAGGFWRKLVG